MKNIDTIIAEGIAHCKGNIHCENITLKAGMKEALTIAKEDVIAYDRKDSHLDVTMNFLFVIILITTLSLVLKSLRDGLWYIVLAILSITMVAIALYTADYRFVLASAGIAVAGIVIGMFKGERK